MGTADAGRFDSVAEGPGAEGPGADGPAALQLVRAAATLRWNRPDLTATLAELAVETAADADTWVAAAGWLLHGRAVLGDGRETACELLDGLGRWGDAGAELMAGPAGRRLRVELAGPARRIGEPGLARALLSAQPGLDDAELRADVLTELARCAVDDDPDSAEEALRAADRAWQDLACPPGVASVKLLSAAWQRQAGGADAAIEQATDGLQRLNAGGRRAGATASDHVAAALTAEWIAALVEAGRLDEARGDAVPAANRLLAVARTGRQTAGLRLALARVIAAAESPEAVLAALDAAAQDAADSDVPELESACRSMLGELHETAGRLDVALGALRTAMAAERRDRDRGSRLHARLTATAESWASRPSRHAAAPSLTGPSSSPPGHRGDPLSPWPAATPAGGRDADLGRATSVNGVLPARSDAAGHGAVGAAPTGSSITAEPFRTRAEAPVTAREVTRNGASPHRAVRNNVHDSTAHDKAHDKAHDNPAHDAAATGRRARRLAAETHGGDSEFGESRAPYRNGDAGPAGDPAVTFRLGSRERDLAPYGGWGGVSGGSLIGDALLLEFAHGASPGGADRAPSTRSDESSRSHDPVRNGERHDLGAPADDPLFGRRPARDGRPPADARGDGSGSDGRTVRWDTTAPFADRRPSPEDDVSDTVVLGAAAGPGSPFAHPSDPAHLSDDAASRRPAEPAAQDPRTAEPGAGSGRHGSPGGQPGRRASSDTDGLGLADLLAGALAAYRNL